MFNCTNLKYRLAPNEINTMSFVMQGGSIYGHIPAKQIDRKAPLLELDKTYLISKFHVKNSRTMYVPFVKEFMIEITGLTSVITVRDPPDGLPNYVYNITPYSDLNPTYPHSAVYVGNYCQNTNPHYSPSFSWSIFCTLK